MAESSESEDESSDRDFTDAKDNKRSKDAKDGKDGKDVKKKSARQKKCTRLAIIIWHLADSYVYIVYARYAGSSLASMRKLDKMYEKRCTASRIYFKRQWQNLQMKPDGT